MSIRPITRKVGASVCAAMLMCAATLPAQAAMVGTDQVLTQARADIDRAELIRMLDRDQVRSELQALGVDPDAAKERVARMSDAEVAELQGRIGDMPVGGDALGIILIIFLVFVITDAIGATDIFPFIDAVD